VNYVCTHTYDDQTVRPALSEVEVWFQPDPAEQFSNPYLAMGNSPVMYVDTDARWRSVSTGPDGEFAILVGNAFNAPTTAPTY
jgi:hypothetical protein